MCGIVGYIGKQKAVPVLINGLKSLEYRGYDSAGIAVLSNNKIDVIKDKGRVANIESNPLINTLTGTIGIGHTRWATHGIPSKTNSHPHLNNSKTIAVVHNGIIENYNELKAKLLQNNYTLLSETDSEVIPNLIDLNNNGNILEAISKTLNEVKGSYALGIISTELPNQIIIAKKNNPIVIGKGQNEFFIASDIPAIASHTEDFYFLDDEQIAVISENSISFYDINLNNIDLPLKNIKFDVGVAEKNGYEDYMLKEIYEQPRAIRETIGSFLTENNPINLNIDIDFKEINKIFIIACGTAMHAGMATKYAFEHFCQIPTEIDMASEFRYRNPIINNKTICIFISQSGETADTILITNQNSKTDELSENKSITKSDINKVHYLIEVPEINTFLSPISTIIPMQLFAYYISKAKKLDVDKPRNLAKSITVE